MTPKKIPKQTEVEAANAKRVAAALASGKRIVLGALVAPRPVPAKSAAPALYVVPKDPAAAFAAVEAAIAKVLGLPPGSKTSDIVAALDALVAAMSEQSPAAIEAAARSFGCSPREARRLAELKVDPAKYARLKGLRRP